MLINSEAMTNIYFIASYILFLFPRYCYVAALTCMMFVKGSFIVKLLLCNNINILGALSSEVFIASFSGFLSQPFKCLKMSSRESKRFSRIWNAQIRLQNICLFSFLFVQLCRKVSRTLFSLVFEYRGYKEVYKEA